MEQGKPGSEFIVDTKLAAELLELSEREVMRLARVGSLLFKLEGGKYQTTLDELEQEWARRARDRDVG